MIHQRYLGIGFAIGILLMVSCKEEDAATPAAELLETTVVCTRCDTTSVLHLSATAEEESWPKECPSC